MLLCTIGFLSRYWHIETCPSPVGTQRPSCGVQAASEVHTRLSRGQVSSPTYLPTATHQQSILDLCISQLNAQRTSATPPISELALAGPWWLAPRRRSADERRVSNTIVTTWRTLARPSQSTVQKMLARTARNAAWANKHNKLCRKLWQKLPGLPLGRTNINKEKVGMSATMWSDSHYVVL